jgi:hypothetical protein
MITVDFIFLFVLAFLNKTEFKLHLLFMYEKREESREPSVAVKDRGRDALVERECDQRVAGDSDSQAPRYGSFHEARYRNDHNLMSFT